MIDEYGPWAVIAGGSEGRRGVRTPPRRRGPEPGADRPQARPAGGDGRGRPGEGGGGPHAGAGPDLPDPLQKVREVTDGLDVGLLIFNAGANSYGHEFVSGDLKRFQGVIDLNITAQLAFTHHFGAQMKERGRGGLLLVGSLAGYMGQAQISIYSAVKSFGRVFAEGCGWRCASTGWTYSNSSSA